MPEMQESNRIYLQPQVFGMTNYTKGRAQEYRAMKELEEENFVSIRTAGSHGMFDVIAINENSIRLIQIKKTIGKKVYLPADELNKIINMKCPTNVTKELWVRANRKWTKSVIP